MPELRETFALHLRETHNTSGEQTGENETHPKVVTAN
jgi:hypothetical protein